MNSATAPPTSSVPTPWGLAGSLRERMLRPGPGVPAAEVARNQRERLFAATVATVATRGYAAARVTDLVEVSGVSRRSFYDLFPDKSACLLATIEATHDWMAERLGSVPPGSWEERATAVAVRLAELIASQPAAARLLLIDGYGAGVEVGRVLDAATEALTGELRAQALRDAPLAEIAPEATEVVVGATLATACECLLKEREADLPRLMPEVMRLMLDFRPPPEPLKPAPRLPTAAAETLEAPDHHERILRAFVVLAAEVGYANVTIEQLARRAMVAPATFYANFSGKEDVLMAALDSAGAQMVAAILPAFRRNPSWPLGVHAAFDALFGFLAARPALTRLLLVEVYVAGAPALAHRGLALRPLEVLFGEGRRNAAGLTAPALDALEGGITCLARRQVLAEGAEALPALTPLCTYLSLAPFIGAAEACAVANRDARPGDPAGTPAPALGTVDAPLGQAILDLVTRVPATLDGIAEEMGQPREVVLGELRRMEEAGLVDQSEKTPGGLRYGSVLGVLPTWQWDPMSLTERHRISARVGALIEGDVRRAVEAGTFDARVDRQLTRVALHLDEQGWREMGEVHEQALKREVEIRDQSMQRLAEAGERGSEARSIRALFEMPDASGFSR